jgi:branched-subunit amino acid aminotransferase/4-amino-4-deoxychorismate lyase
MSLLRHRRERLAVRMENELRAEIKRLQRQIRRLRIERDQAEAELRALRGEVA